MNSADRDAARRAERAATVKHLAKCEPRADGVTPRVWCTGEPAAPGAKYVFAQNLSNCAVCKAARAATLPMLRGRMDVRRARAKRLGQRLPWAI